MGETSLSHKLARKLFSDKGPVNIVPGQTLSWILEPIVHLRLNTSN